jgi:hypothetical protein
MMRMMMKVWSLWESLGLPLRPADLSRDSRGFFLAFFYISSKAIENSNIESSLKVDWIRPRQKMGSFGVGHFPELKGQAGLTITLRGVLEEPTSL